ncbi:molecular chaperone DnaJ [Polyangium sp. 6x1]|uniref:molecular chaperone DnaJ n=1 Tax=Polyangium sp. 6x1 TaxID=3042689 RepID=UPI00248313FF|nr:molecular chaperone DnaJ [Polyangium sp. 6x1]MDI1446484.1 molecular chaperone DnaJ [Polyangium sp. 6x1]
MRDPYDVLGVDRSATQDEIKSAFRKLAAQHHPDKNPGDDGAHQRFKEINAAYQILSDPQKRAAFDRFGPMGANAASAGGPFGGGAVDLNDLNIDGLFGDLLGALGIKVGDRGNLQKEIRISFEEAAFGCTKEITYERVVPCDDCGGVGAAKGTQTERCSLCLGRGRVRMQQGVFPIAIERPCTRCRGTGRIVLDPCKPCRGAGIVPKPRTIEVTIPGGIENGTPWIVARGGNCTRPDRAPGDLELTIRVSPHEFFRRVGDDVVCSLPISFPVAALGGEIEVPTLEGKQRKLRIPAGTQPGAVVRVKGQGVTRRVMGGRGDQLVEIGIQIPTKLTDEQKELITRLASTLGEVPQEAEHESFMDKLKNLFG